MQSEVFKNFQYPLINGKKSNKKKGGGRGNKKKDSISANALHKNKVGGRD
jgi:hypothetical protein